MKFYSFWRSLAAFRVRIALNIKGIVPDRSSRRPDQGRAARGGLNKVNPQMLLPALIDGDGPILFQSIAIMEYLDETHPPAADPAEGSARPRARARACADHAADSHPLMVPRVRNFIEHELKLESRGARNGSGTGSARGSPRWKGTARDKETGKYAHGDAVTMADICAGRAGRRARDSSRSTSRRTRP